MSLHRTKRVPEQVLQALKGKIIREIAQDIDHNEHGFVTIGFTDGTIFWVKEISQTGEIETRAIINQEGLRCLR